MIDRAGITYAELDRLLVELGFTEVPVKPSWKAYRWAASEKLVLLPNQPQDSTVRPVELASVRRHLVEAGLVDVEEFEAWLAGGSLPRPSA